MKKALYAGTFDPITYGHIDVITRATKIFDRVYIGVSAGPKNTLFSQKERIELINIVLGTNAKIEVLGTAFNVWSRNNITKVIVKEGIVRLSPLKSKTEFVIISANHMSQIIEDKKPLIVKQLDANRYIGWPNDKLIFEHSSLSDFVYEIERQYDVNITILSENIKNLKLTGTFDNLTIDQVLSSVCLTLNLEYSCTNFDDYIIKEKKEM